MFVSQELWIVKMQIQVFMWIIKKKNNVKKNNHIIIFQKKSNVGEHQQIRLFGCPAYDSDAKEGWASLSQSNIASHGIVADGNISHAKI